MTRVAGAPAAIRSALVVLPLLCLCAACDGPAAAPGVDPVNPTPACADGAISTACTCGGATRTSGYCCGSAWQGVACGPTPPSTSGWCRERR